MYTKCLIVQKNKEQNKALLRFHSYYEKQQCELLRQRYLERKIGCTSKEKESECIITKPECRKKFTQMCRVIHKELFELLGKLDLYRKILEQSLTFTGNKHTEEKEAKRG